MSASLTTAGIERKIPPDCTLVSKTNLEGVVTFVNQAFAEISGYTQAEIIGKTSSFLRHPDVPEAVFKHLWHTLQKGRPWHGVLKNLCKNDDYFWSEIYIVPIWKKGNMAGYMSAHCTPTPQQISDAQADFAFASKNGKVRADTGFRPRRYLSVKRGVLTGIFFVIAATTVSAWIGVQGLQNTSDLIHEVVRQSDASTLLTKGNQQAANAATNALLAVQHAPGKTAAGDAKGLAEHLRLVQVYSQELTSIASELDAKKTLLLGLSARLESTVPGFINRTAATTEAITYYIAASQALIQQGINPVSASFTLGQFESAQDLVLNKIAPLQNELNLRSNELSDLLLKTSLELRQTVDDLYAETKQLLILWSLFTVAVVGLSGILFFRGTMRPLNRAMTQMRNIAEGHLSEKPSVYEHGETGKVASTVATMQIQLQVMLNEIHIASTQVRTQVTKLNGEILSMLNNTEDQYDKATQINTALERSGADIGALASCAMQVHQLAKTITESSEPLSASDRTALFDLTYQTAALANLHVLGAEEIGRLSDHIMDVVVLNRENSNNSWEIGQRLEATSTALNDMVEKFD